jgi:type VI secretion system lysozyme-like protein
MRSILADIRRPDASVDAIRATRDSVVANLRQICGTPRGSVLLLADYGIEDPVRIFHEYPGSVADVQRGIAETFSRYEPRLLNVSVRRVQNDDLDLVLRFHIEATLVVNGTPVPVRFTSTLDTSNHFDIL